MDREFKGNVVLLRQKVFLKGVVLYGKDCSEADGGKVVGSI